MKYSQIRRLLNEKELNRKELGKAVKNVTFDALTLGATYALRENNKDKEQEYRGGVTI